MNNNAHTNDIHKHQIIVWDPDGKYWEGSLVNHSVAQTIRGRGGAALPVDPDLFPICGVGGYMRRGWGAGWPLDSVLPRAISPLVVFLTSEHRVLHWVARLVVDEQRVEKAKLEGLDSSGSIQIMSYSTRGNLFKAPITPRTEVQKIKDFGKADVHGGWTINGIASVHPSTEGVAAFALYGAGAGIRVAWAAVSVTKG